MQSHAPFQNIFKFCTFLPEFSNIYIFLFEQIAHLHVKVTKSYVNKKLITTKVTANKTRYKKVTDTWDTSTCIRDNKTE